MSKKTFNKPSFWDAFAALPENHKATISVAMKMYSRVMSNGFGSVTFSQKDIEQEVVFDGNARPLDASKAADFASMAKNFVMY
jgi:hypothetical protein